MRHFRNAYLIGCTLAVLLSEPTFAQQPAPPIPPNDWSIETVTVTAQSTGPAYWHARKGQTDVWILGVVSPIPSDFAWNTNRLIKLIDGASAVLLPPRGEANIFQSAWFLLTENDLLGLPDGQTLDGVLGPSLAARFAAARKEAGQDADRYSSDAPVVAALRLERDFAKASSLTADEPVDTIESLARRHNREVRRIATYDAMPAIEAVLKLPPEKSRVCVEAAVNDVEYESAHAAAAADAWAIGNIPGVKANFAESKIFDCLLEISPAVSSLNDRAIADTTAAIESALNGGRQTVVVVSIGQLLRKKGVLDHLLADGVAVEGPPE